MNVQVSMKKLIAIAVLLAVVGLGVWWFGATKDERAANKEVKLMIKYAQRQALEIAIIEQSSKLSDYKKQLAAMQESVPPIPSPIVPVEDPKDVD